MYVGVYDPRTYPPHPRVTTLTLHTARSRGPYTLPLPPLPTGRYCHYHIRNIATHVTRLHFRYVIFSTILCPVPHRCLVGYVLGCRLAHVYVTTVGVYITFTLPAYFICSPFTFVERFMRFTLDCRCRHVTLFTTLDF